MNNKIYVLTKDCPKLNKEVGDWYEDTDIKKIERLIADGFIKELLAECPLCGEMRPYNEVYERMNPWTMEMDGVEEYEVMCDDCEEQMIGDI